MINLTLSFSFLYLKLFFENRTLSLRFTFKGYDWIDFEKEFHREFKCAQCNQDVEYEDSTMKLCDECLDEYMKYWRKKLR